MSEKKLYKINDEGHFVFEEKHAKIKTFCHFFVLVMLISFGFSMRIMSGLHEGVLKHCLWSAGLAASVSFIVALYFASKEKNYTIVVKDSTVDVTLGRKTTTYSVSDFVCGEAESVRGEGRKIKTLIFCSPTGVDEIRLESISVRKLNCLSEILFKRQGTGAEGYEPLKDPVFTVTDAKKNAANLPALIGFCAVMVLMTLAMIIFLGIKLGFNRPMVILLMVAWIFANVSSVVLINSVRKAVNRCISTLSFNDTQIIVDETSFPVNNIESITMAQPNFIGNGPCVLKIKSKDSEKTYNFTICRKLKRGQGEYERSEGCSAEYPCLYLSIEDLCSRHGIRFNP